MNLIQNSLRNLSRILRNAHTLRYAVPVALCVLSLPLTSTASIAETALAPLIIGRDLGGMLRPRYLQIAELYETGREVQITGPTCASACTLYLGLDNVCVSRQTRFGFHGPTRVGLFPVSGQRFDNVTTTMSSFYPEPVRHWFMEEARYLTHSMRYISGAFFISLGYREC